MPSRTKNLGAPGFHGAFCPVGEDARRLAETNDPWHVQDEYFVSSTTLAGKGTARAVRVSVVLEPGYGACLLCVYGVYISEALP